MSSGVRILGTGSAVPERRLTNADFEKMVDTNDEWIRTRTGIEERRIADPDKASSDYAVEAAKKALEQANIAAEDVDLIICATVTPDYLFPATACLVQDRLGAKKAAAFDLSAGCSGFTYAMNVAAPLIRTGAYKYAVVIGVDMLTRITDYTDRSTCILFGDAAGAVVLGPSEAGKGLLSFELGSDGSAGALLMQEGGGSRNPSSRETVEGRQHFIRMNGREVFKFAVKVMDRATESVLAKAGLAKEDISLLIPHQANYRIIESAMKRFGLTEDKVYVNVHKYGNTSSASIPVALDEANRAGKIKADDIVILVGFGAGLTWGATLIRW
ncbi:ketoacyl-ACP synthase III [Fodinisporobacter ferrooxydans]|uniref:Beta-ketoacyl-[acyl-carrier-protein] synthase III n=1 Tax=Fodinisporobacter ferrooxydans TaxID=2901836 RepID=A0ABY4CJ89_9BACL|nr:ketoacyl-ACP synthase III [Alicyclobacillaceae bacterium MYW30-H2]